MPLQLKLYFTVYKLKNVAISKFLYDGKSFIFEKSDHSNWANNT